MADSTTIALKQALDLRHQRQQLLATNIANADTPGYTPVDLAFEGALAEALGEASAVPPGFERTHLAHLEGTMEAGELASTQVARPDVTNTLDGNGVDLDMELARIADNALRYDVTAESHRRRLGMLLNVIADMNRI